MLLPPITRGLDQEIATIRRETAADPAQAVARLSALVQKAAREGRAGERIVLLTVRAREQARERKLDAAIADLTEAIGINGGYPMPLHLRGLYYAELGEHEKAISDLSKAIGQEPRYAAPFNVRGQIYAGRFLYTEAIGDFERFLALRPDDLAARTFYAGLLSATGEKAKALVQIDRVLAGRPDDLTVLSEKAVYLRGLKDDQRALEIADKIVDTEEFRESGLLLRGRIHLARGDYTAAEADLKRAFDGALAKGLPHPFTALYLQVARLRLGRGDSADLLRRQELSNSGPWPMAMANYLADRIDANALLASVPESELPEARQGRVAEAQFFIGQREVARGATEAAVGAFRASVATGAGWIPEREFAGRELERLGRL